MSLQQVLSETKEEFPNFKVVPKSESLFMRAIDIALKICTFGVQRYFMLSYASTLGSTIYVAKNWDHLSDGKKEQYIRHERTHLRQSKKWSPVIYALLYLFLPLPIGFAWFRMKFEMEAYEESLRCVYEREGPEGLSPQCKDFIVAQFTGPSYLWTWVLKGTIEKWYDRTVKNITQSSPESSK